MKRTGVLEAGAGAGAGDVLLGAGGSGVSCDRDMGGGSVPVAGGSASARNGAGIDEPGGGVTAVELRARSLLAGAEAALRAVTLEGLDEEGLGRMVAGLGRLRDLANAMTLRSVGRLERLRAGSAREALVEGAKLSGSAAKRVTEAVRQVEEMPNVAALLEAGELTLESVFALGCAARQCGAAVVDGSDELLDQAVSGDDGSFKRLARRFAQRHDPSAGGDLLKGQRNSRKADLFVGSDGMGVLKGEMDPVSFGLLEQAVDERKDYLWRKDGGRDGTPDAVRNNGQRTMDAIFELCTGRDALTHRPLAADDGPRGVRSLPPGRIIAVTVGVVDGTESDGGCEIIGVGPVPPTVLDSISPDDYLVGAIFGGNGQPLWLSRMQRLANAAQYVAVALRDRGCVLCRAPMHRCRLHHVDEFHADEGLTDIENLAALCSNCHQWLHRTNRRLVRFNDAHGTITWATRPRSRGPTPGKNGAHGVGAKPGSFAGGVGGRGRGSGVGGPGGGSAVGVARQDPGGGRVVRGDSGHRGSDSRGSGRGGGDPGFRDPTGRDVARV